MNMILISHRGNLKGRIPEQENQPEYILNALQKGYDVEVDFWCMGGILSLGHDHSEWEIDARIEDCFSTSTFNDIIDMISEHGKCLVLCDGGDKPKEFNEFSKYLKSGDHIMCHDYCKDDIGHKFATDYWQWPYHIDTFYENISNAVMENKLTPYDHDAWQFFLWGSFTKE